MRKWFTFIRNCRSFTAGSGSSGPLQEIVKGNRKNRRGWSTVGVGMFAASVLSMDLYYYLYKYQATKALNQDEYQEFKVLDIDQINHDTFKINIQTGILELLKGSSIAVPVHVSVKDDSCQIARSYTPIKIEKDHITLLVKRYQDGSVSRMLTSLKPGDLVWLRGLIPTFTYTRNAIDHLIMVAGGTGITPMYQLASSILETDKKTLITLLYANKSQQDILLKKELDEMHEKYENFTVKYTLENYASDWDQGKGRISIKDLDFSKEKSAVLVCGPFGFIEAIAGSKISQDDQGPLGGYLKQLGFKDGQVLKL
jgi:cytochrome-b5 reductase